MRVVFIGKSHEFSVVPLRAIMGTHVVVGIIESAPRIKSSKASRFLYNLGCKIFNRQSLWKLARKSKLPYMYLGRENQAELVSFLNRIRPDILCVTSLTQLLKKQVLQIPKYGAINLHPSMLPKYHGPYPWFWQYYDFEKQWGITVHVIDEGQDTGPIVKQESFALETGKDIADATKIVSSIGARLMLESINEIEEGTAVFSPQPPHSYPKARIVLRDEKLIDWQHWSIERVWHVMRGTYPWLDAVEYPAHIKGTWKICEFERCACDDAPGQLYKDDKGYYVAHKEGKIRLLLEPTSFGMIKKVLKNF
jgi:methionyl-tRNA formyltransferase